MAKKNFITKKNFFIFIISAFVAYILLIPVGIIYSGRKKVYFSVDDVEKHNVGIVFGAGVKADGEPHDMLRDRLIVASKLYKSGKIEKILVSGDNRFQNYNEPQVMYNYLIDEFRIPPEDIYRDYAGRRSYDTCIRAKEIFGVEKALLITQGYHLPRTIYLCDSLGVESTGLSGTLTPYNSFEYYKLREIFAIYKAWLDIHLIHPAYVGGRVEADLT